MDINIEQISVDASRVNQPVNFDALPVLATRNLVLFPDTTTSVALRRDAAVAVAEYCEAHHTPLGVLCQKSQEVEHPALMRDMYRFGVVADVLKVLELPDGTKSAIVHSRMPFRVVGNAQSAADGIMCAHAVPIVYDEGEELETDETFRASAEACVKLAVKILSTQGDISAAAGAALQTIDDPLAAVHTVLSNFPFTTEEKMRLLRTRSSRHRVELALRLLLVSEQKANITKEVMDRARAELNDQQRRMFMQQQIEVLQQQLYGDVSDDIADLRQRMDGPDSMLPATDTRGVRKTIEKEINKLERISPQSPDYSVAYNYLDILLSLPWDRRSPLPDPDIPPARLIADAREMLDLDHAAMTKVKERVLEQLASIIHNPASKLPILCLVGAPGVGKTSLGRSVAAALGRKFQRVSLGGLHDESEIRGHRRTYIGAMPGRIIDAIKRAGTLNPVIMLDEIDKVSSDYKGDPAAALLEVLDPEQNSRFHDNYVDIDFDLSNVLFIATANTLSTLSQPLLDRMEVVELSGYIPEEKVEIAQKHLLPSVLSDLTLEATPEDAPFTISRGGVLAIIDGYTRESGVRQLQKCLAKIARRYVMASLSDEDFPKVVEPEHLQKLLGTAPFTPDMYEGNDIPGVVTGLAWTAAGGEILLAEAALSPGKGNVISATGNLGDVMKESVSIAAKWVKANAATYGVDLEMLEKNDLNIHFPEGAIPKDGPSAGITIATAILSRLTGRRMRERTAMTGEITLRGRVLPVGGIKEKILAAKRAGINTIILSQRNRKDVLDIEPRYTEGLTFCYVDTMDDVVSAGLLPLH